MESNLFPIFLIGFLLIIVLLLQKPKEKPIEVKSKTKKSKCRSRSNVIDEIKHRKEWHKLKKTTHLPDPLFSNEWQKQFKQYNQKLNNNKTKLNNSFFNTKEQMWETLTLNKETFENQPSYINESAQKDASNQQINANYLRNTPVAATDFEQNGGEHSWALQTLDSFYTN